MRLFIQTAVLLSLVLMWTPVYESSCEERLGGFVLAIVSVWVILLLSAVTDYVWPKGGR